MQLLLYFQYKTLQGLDVHKTIKDVEAKYYVTLCWWLYFSAATKEGFNGLFKTIEIVTFLLLTKY